MNEQHEEYVADRPPEVKVQEEIERNKFQAALAEYMTTLQLQKRDKQGNIKQHGVPESPMVEKAWGWLSNETVLTRKDNIDIAFNYELLRAFKCYLIDNMTNEELQKNWLDLLNLEILALDRGLRSNDGFERRMLETTISEGMATSTSSFKEDRGGVGFLKRLVGGNK